jgi:hypothetical protein
VWTKVTSFVEQRITPLSQVLILGVFLLWIAAQFIDPLEDFITEGTFFNVVTLVLLFEIGRRVVELKKDAGTDGALVFATQEAAWTEMQGRIKSIRPKTVDMIEYSGHTVINIIEEVLQVQPKATIRLLVCHPDHALSPFETQRIEAVLGYLQRHMSDTGLEVRCYTTPAGIRGRNYARQWVSLGWYSYHRRGNKPATEIQGHLNAMVVASVASAAGRDLMETFDRAFADVWNHPETVEWTSLAPSGG